MNASQETHSIWQKTEPPFLPSLGSHQAVDVCVVGGGIAGLLTAHRLLAEGRSVALIERNGFLEGESLHTSAHLAAVLDVRYHELRSRHGADGARAAAESHLRAIDDIEHVVASESIDCGFVRVPGHLFLAPGDSVDHLERELAACHEAGLTGAEYVSAPRSPLFPVGPCLRFPRQARFHAGRFLAGLARAVERNGGRIYAHTEALAVEGGSPARVTTNRGFQIVCETVVEATNAPLNDLIMHSKMAPHRSYVLALELPLERADASLFWDTAEPYHYVRTVDDMVLIGGADHRTGLVPGEDPFAALAAWARDRLGLTGNVRYRWSGQVLEPHDGLAYIGRSPSAGENVLIVTGHSGSGLTYGAVAARVIADLLAGRESRLASLYDPSRINIHSLSTYVAENAKAAACYADWLTNGDVSTIEEIPPGEGAVLREGLHKLAVYRDPRGRPHFFSAACPHRQGIVHWNGIEKTWDCPCHGSRFDRLGHVLNGPATCGLRMIADNIVGDAISA